MHQGRKTEISKLTKYLDNSEPIKIDSIKFPSNDKLSIDMQTTSNPSIDSSSYPANKYINRKNSTFIQIPYHLRAFLSRRLQYFGKLP